MHLNLSGLYIINCAVIFFLNRIDNIYCHNMALSNVDSISDAKPLNFDRSWNIGGYSLVENTESPRPLDEKTEKISFKELNDIQLVNSPTLIKIDVEGMELEVLQGGLNLIRSSNFPRIIFEFNEGDPKESSVLRLLMGLGYQIKKYADSDYLAQHPDFSNGIMI